MSGTRAISTTSRRELSSSFFFPLQGKAPKEIHAILSETLACFLPGRAKDLSAPLQIVPMSRLSLTGDLNSADFGIKVKGKKGKSVPLQDWKAQKVPGS